jgi:hypothetical protein
MTDAERSYEVRRGQEKNMRELIDFLRAAGQGNVFYSRNDHAFAAYRLHLDTSYGGFVLLDATCDLTGLVGLHPNVVTVETAKVSYKNLELFHMDMPKRFMRISDVVKIRRLAVEYGEYITQNVLQNTKEGDEVLIITHLVVLSQELIGTAEDPGEPLIWEGRRVNTQSWGAGVGLNKFRHKTHVFQFGDFIRPRWATICQTNAWSQTAPTVESLNLARGVRKAGDIYSPKGMYRLPHEGHILGASKQLAMRGAARQIDMNGCCFPMKLFMTMDLDRFLPNLSRLYPGARPPLLASPLKNIPPPVFSGRQALLRLLMDTKKSLIGADEVEAVTRLAPRNLSREYEAIGESAQSMGWTLASASEIGLPGRMRYLVNEAKYGRQMLRAS